MIGLFMVLFTLLSQAVPPRSWSLIVEVKDRHEFYQNNIEVGKPANSWQNLFSVVYYDINLNLTKDCVLYKVPGEELGLLKLKTIPEKLDCEQFIFLPGDSEISGIQSLQFSITDSHLNVSMKLSEKKIEKWDVDFQKKFKSTIPGHLTSSADYKGPKLILLAPEKTSAMDVERVPPLPEGTLCHSVSDECVELSASNCNACPQGFYEIPNGCSQGPKYCGVHECGQKGQPACRRGMRYQKVRKKFECRIDNSFAYCAPGVSIECEGNKASCR